MIMNDLRVTLVQPDIIWQKNQENLLKYSEILDNSPVVTDLLLFPEMFQTGFSVDPSGIAEKMDGESVRWMKRTAERFNCAVAGSLIIKENRRFYNRLIYIDQYENLTWYDKRHLFAYAGEKAKFTAGLRQLIVPLKDWHISFQICYDLRFPVWARNRGDYDVLVNLANWPDSRSEVWTTLLRARAMENQSYVIGVNRVGTDHNNIKYTGKSMVIDPRGKIHSEIAETREGLLSVTLSREELDKYRNDFPAWQDRDNFEIAV